LPFCALQRRLLRGEKSSLALDTFEPPEENNSRSCRPVRGANEGSFPVADRPDFLIEPASRLSG
jgi:hypothetical protein